MNVSIVTITKNGKGRAVYVDGTLVLAVDIGRGDNDETFDEVCEALARLCDTEIKRTMHQPQEGWTWESVTEMLLPWLTEITDVHTVEPLVCVNCKSEYISIRWQSVTCSNCGTVWKEEWVFSNWHKD
jgi:hypothetical protein